MIPRYVRRFCLLLAPFYVLTVIGYMLLLVWHRQQRIWHQQDNVALIAAIKQNDENTVLSLLARGADPNARDVHFTVSRDCHCGLPASHSLPALLLALGMRPPTSPQEDISLTVNHNPIIARALIEHGANINIVEGGLTPLCLAVLQQHELIPLLLDHGADPNAPEGGDTPLFKAIRGYNIAAINLLLDRGADINATNDADLTPLMTAAGRMKRSASIALVRALLSHHPVLDLRNREGDTALSTAKEYGTPSIVTLLKQAGAIE